MKGIKLLALIVLLFLVHLFIGNATAEIVTHPEGTSFQFNNDGLYGGAIYSLATSPNYDSDQMIFAATERGLFKSTNGGTSWLLSHNAGIAPVFSPNFANDKTLFAGTYRSTDGGSSWERLNIGFAISCYSLSPNYGVDKTIFVGSYEGIYKSTNGGESWELNKSGLTGVNIRAVAISPNYSVDQTLFVSSVGQGVFKSTDGSKTWTNMSFGIDEKDKYIPSIAVSPDFAADQTLYAVSSEVIYKSSNGGASWFKVRSISRTEDVYTAFAQIRLSPTYATDQTVYVGTYWGGVLKSINGGNSWAEIRTGLTHASITSIVIASNKTIFVGTLGGVFKSDTGGEKWFPANNGITTVGTSCIGLSPDFLNDQTIFVGTNSGVFKSVDGGASWNAANSGLSTTYVINLAVSSSYKVDKTVFVGTYGGLFKSIDSGETWSEINIPVPNKMVSSLSLSPNFATDQTIYIGVSQKIFKSIDRGMSWKELNIGFINQFSNINSIAISPSFMQDQTVFAATDGSIFKSTNGGDSWIEVSKGITGTYTGSIKISPNYPVDQTLFISSLYEGVFKSTNGGALWSSVGSEIIGKNIGSVMISTDYASNQTVYAIKWTGLFKSTDGGASWYAIDSSAFNLANVPFVLSPDIVRDRTFFIGAWGGIIKVQEPEVSAYLGGTFFNITGTALDNTSGIQKVELSFDGGRTWYLVNDTSDNGSWSSWSYNWSLPEDGVYAIMARSVDTAGNTKGTNNWKSVIVDNKSPETTLSPVSGIYASSQAVLFNCIDVGSGCSKIYYTTDGSSPTTSSNIYSGPLTISESTMLKYFAVDRAGHVEPVKISYYNIDTVPPVGTILLNGGNRYTPGTTIVISLSCTDSGSGCAQMQFSNDNINWSELEQFNTVKYWSLSQGDGSKTVYVKFKDGAGNLSLAYSASITKDATSPIGSIVINAGERYTNSVFVNLTLSCIDAISGCANMQLSNDNITWTAVEPYSSDTKSWTLPSGDGMKMVYVKFEDAAGNGFGSSASINIDTTKPFSSITDPANPVSGDWVTNGPYGGNVISLATSPDFIEDKIVYAGTYSGLFKSTDGGASWKMVKGRVMLNSLFWSIGISPDYKTDNTIFAATGDGVIRSVNGGASWDLQMGGKDSRSIAVSRNFAIDKTVFVGTTEGLFKSTNGGMSWFSVNNGITNNFIWSISVSPAYATDQTVFAATSDGVFKSTNGGTSWINASTGMMNRDVRCLAVSPNYFNDYTIYAGTDGGVFKSLDGGTSWSQVSVQLSGKIITSITISPNFMTDKTIYIGTYSGVYKSSDSGISWSDIETGITKTYIWSLAISPGFDTDDTIYSGTDGGVFRSTDRGVNWSSVNTKLTGAAVYSLGVSPDYARDRTIYAGTMVGMFKSVNSGGSWIAVNNGIDTTNIWSIALSPGYSSDQTVYAGTNDGVFKSSDGGSSWRTMSSGITSRPISALVMSPAFSSDETLFAGTWGGVFKSNDGGISWHDSSIGITERTVWSIAISPNYIHDKTVFAATWGGVFKSTNGGESWQAVNAGMINRFAWSIAVSPDYSTDPTVYAGTDAGVFKSTNGGATWSPTGFINSVSASRFLAISPDYARDHTLYVGIFEGLLKSTNSGSSWSYESPWLNHHVVSIAVSPNYAIDPAVYIGTESGVFGKFERKEIPTLIGKGYTLTGTALDGFGSGIQKVEVSTDDGSSWHLAEDSSGNGSWATWRFTWVFSADGPYKIRTRATDKAGNIEVVGAGITVSVAVDDDAPISTASPKGGIYATSQRIILRCDDGSGTGCDKIYYTTDGSTPTRKSSVYRKGIDISSTTILKFFAVDAAGNVEDVKTEHYIVNPLRAVISTPPSNPSNLVATSNSDGSISISWDIPSDAVLSGFNIYRDGVKINTNLIKTSAFVDSGIVLGGSFTYRVTSVDFALNESGGAEITGKSQVAADVIPSSPSGIVIENTGTGYSLKVSWRQHNAVNISGYRVYWGTVPGIYVNSYDAGKVTSYTISGLTEGARYYVTVTAYGINGNESSKSLEFSSVPRSIASRPAAPINLSVVPGRGRLTVSWDAVGSVAGYKVYIGEEADRYGVPVRTGETTYTYERLQNGKTYYIAVSSYYLSDGSTYSVLAESERVSLSATPGYNELPALPSTFVAKDCGTGDSIALGWDRTDNSNIDGYIIAYKESGDAVFSGMVSTGVKWKHIIKGFTNGKTYTFNLYAHDANGSISPPVTASATVSATASVDDVTPPDSPILSAVPGDKKVTLIITPSSGDVSSYNLYRYDFVTGKYVPLVESLNGLTYEHVNGVENGQIMVYVATAVDQAGNESGYSNPASAVPNKLPGDIPLEEDPPVLNRVDGFDINEIAKGFGAAIGSPNYNPNADLNGDGFINGDDILVLAPNYSKVGE